MHVKIHVEYGSVIGCQLPLDGHDLVLSANKELHFSNWNNFPIRYTFYTWIRYLNFGKKWTFPYLSSFKSY